MHAGPSVWVTADSMFLAMISVLCLIWLYQMKKKSSIILSAFQIQDNTLYLFKFTSTVQYVYVFYIQCTYS